MAEEREKFEEEAGGMIIKMEELEDVLKKTKSARIPAGDGIEAELYKRSSRKLETRLLRLERSFPENFKRRL